MPEIDLKRINITVVYETLRDVFISIDKIKRAYDDAKIIDGPEYLKIVDFVKEVQKCRIQANYNENRLHINMVSLTEDLKEINDYPLDHFVKVANKLEEAVEDSKNIIGYGFNFDGKGEFDGERADEVFKNIFIKESNDLESKLGGNISKFAPKFMVEYDDFALNVSLNPIDEPANFFKLHLNTHFQRTLFPNTNELKEDLKGYYNKAINNLGEILVR
ncbi:hypothetical protein [Fuchsiella alkaliacetigena]|uniref:hypothetical protein n=1 Tax=Fuchsiella alkaliacetigena TaxID=957042 RepID=UPI00200B0BF8|nr:hypothetical protein [Fuchsiella alkaliacetigena]MCK8823832.1 hypothetical protein [Fuchsiella alkaliacetigena]